MFGDSMADSQVPETNAVRFLKSSPLCVFSHYLCALPICILIMQMEFLVTKNKQYIERMNAIERASNEKLGEYNEFSRPKASKVSVYILHIIIILE